MKRRNVYHTDWAQDCPVQRVIFTTNINLGVPAVSGLQLPELRRVIVDVSGLRPRQMARTRFTVNVSAASGDVVVQDIA